jgi:hypothetical protein
MMRACFVAGRAAGFDDAGAGRLRDLNLLDFREAERVAALVVDLGLVMGSSEVHATPSAAPPQPRPGKTPGGLDPEAGLSRSKSPQQRSGQARKPVKSEQDSCSLVPESATLKAAVVGDLINSEMSAVKNHPDDTTAIEAAKQLVDGHDIELWDRDRFVGRFSPEAK